MKFTGKILILIIAISFGMLGLVDTRVNVRTLDKEILRIQERKEGLFDEISRLRIRRTELKRIERIRKIAKQKLNMVFPDGAMKIIY